MALLHHHEDLPIQHMTPWFWMMCAFAIIFVLLTIWGFVAY